LIPGFGFRMAPFERWTKRDLKPGPAVRRLRVRSEGDGAVSWRGAASDDPRIGFPMKSRQKSRHEAAPVPDPRSDADFRSMVENTWDIIHVVDRQDVIRYISPSVVRVLGYTPEDMIGRRGAEFVHPEDVFRSRAAFEEAIARSGQEGYLEVRLRHRDGSWRTVEVRGAIVRDASGESVAVLNSHDVTERKAVERALRESEERYRLVARATNSAIREWDLARGTCIWEGASSVLLRYASPEIGSRIDWWYERIHPEDRERVINGIQAAVDGVGEAWTEEYRFLRGDDAYAVVLDCCHIARNERGIPVRVVGSLVDVTERKQAESAQRFLARASALLSENLDLEVTPPALARLTLPTLADFCVIDLVEESGELGGILRRVAAVHVNPLREAILRKPAWQRVHAEADRHPLLRAVQTREPMLVTECTDALLAGLAQHPAHRLELKELGICSFMLVPLVAHGRALGVITLGTADSGRRLGPQDLLVAENLAHHAALAIEHAQLYRQAQEAIQARQEVLGVVSHDLRNPLNTIHMSAELLLDSADERRSEKQRSLERIRMASQQMAGMIEDLLDAATIEMGRFTIQPVRYDVARLVREACELLRPLCDEKSLELRYVLAEDLPETEIDPKQIQRVFSNLVGNAIKYTPEGGRIQIRGWAEGEEIHFSVSDTGPGVPPEHQPHVFDRFWQARKGDRRGVGLGLAIARGIVVAHGGRIWLDTGARAGATFCFAIPASGGGRGPAGSRRVIVE
jgi:PAS domain S-box-containing protein